MGGIKRWAPYFCYLLLFYICSIGVSFDIDLGRVHQRDRGFQFQTYRNEIIRLVKSANALTVQCKNREICVNPSKNLDELSAGIPFPIVSCEHRQRLSVCENPALVASVSTRKWLFGSMRIKR